MHHNLRRRGARLSPTPSPTEVADLFTDVRGDEGVCDEPKEQEATQPAARK